MSNLVGYLRRHQPQVYRSLMRGKLLVNNWQTAASRRRNKSLMLNRDVRVDVAGKVGLGGILRLGANALLLGERMSRPVSLSFSSPLYRPTNGPEDWLDVYFDRTGRYYDESFEKIEVGQMPRLPGASFSDEATAMWRYLRVRDDVLEGLNDYPADDLLAIHFRGSDKFLEAPRVARQRVFEAVDEELVANRIAHVFVASDEPSFIAEALERYKNLAYTLPQVANADEDRPAHFSDSPGDVKAREALQTMVMLSRAQICVRTPSSLSDWAATLASTNSRFRLVN